MATALRSILSRSAPRVAAARSRRGRTALIAVALVAPSVVGAAVAASPARAAVPPIDVYVGDRSIVEGDAGPSSLANFPVELSAPATTDTYVWFHTVDGSATSADGDYAPKPAGKLTIAAGRTRGSISVAIVRDTKVEPDETFTVVIDKVTSSPKGAADPAYDLARNVGTGTIIDDDPASSSPTLAIGGVAVPEGNSGTETRLLAVQLSQPAATAEYVYLHTEGESATSGQDFAAMRANSRITIPAGKTMVTIPVTIIADTQNEGDETFRVVIDKVTARVGGAQDPAITVRGSVGEVTIVDDDVPPTAPGAPGPVHADWTPSHNGDAIVTWTAPSVTGGRVPTYLVERSTDLGETWVPVATVAATTTTVPCDTNYYCTFRVTARNAGGDSEPSYLAGNLVFCFSAECLV